VEEIYCWHAPVEDTSMVSWICKGREIALPDSAVNGGTVPHDYTQFVSWAGRRIALPADLKSGRDLPADRRPAKTPLPAPGAPPSGEQWSLVTPCGGFKIGDRVPLVNVLWSSGDYATVRLGPGPGAGAVVLLEKPSGVAADDFIEEQKKRATAFYGLEAGPEPDDMRTLGIELNSRGRCHRAFSAAVAQLVEDSFDDWPLKDNIRSFLWLVEKMESDGLAPVAWVESYLARRRFSDGDRAGWGVPHLRTSREARGSAWHAGISWRRRFSL
jgi:hypothetical protein